MNHGIVDVFAFQEALLIEAAFAVALLAMLWIGFRRWLQHKERMGRLIADQTAERAAQYGADMAGVETRLSAVEQTLNDRGIQAPAITDALDADPVSDAISKAGVRTNP